MKVCETWAKALRLAGSAHQTFKASKLVQDVVYGYAAGLEGQRLVPVPIGFANSRGVSI